MSGKKNKATVPVAVTVRATTTASGASRITFRGPEESGINNGQEVSGIEKRTHDNYANGK